MDPSMILDFSGVCLIVALAFMGLAVWLDFPTSVNAIVIYGRETAEGILTSGDIFYPDDFDGAVLITENYQALLDSFSAQASILNLALCKEQL